MQFPLFADNGRRENAPAFTVSNLADAELSLDSAVTLDVGLHEVVEQVLSAANHLEEAPSRGFLAIVTLTITVVSP